MNLLARLENEYNMIHTATFGLMACMDIAFYDYFLEKARINSIVELCNTPTFLKFLG